MGSNDAIGGGDGSGAAPSPTLEPTTSPSIWPSAADADHVLPVRAAFYYPWFPEAWRQNGSDPFSEYEPSAGNYDGGDAGVIERHVEAMQYGGIDVAIASWWGVEDETNARVPALLAASAGTGLRWSLYYEIEGSGDPSTAELAADLRYIQDQFSADPGYFTIDGRFVIFVYGDATDTCDMAQRWTRANAGIGAYLVLKVFSGYRSCADQPDGWHQYAPAEASDFQPGFSYAISPGFDKLGEPARLVRDLARWERNAREMVASGAPFQLITTFNEWGEGTSVEPAVEWSTPSGFGAYLDVLHEVIEPPAPPAPASEPATVSSPQPGPTVAPVPGEAIVRAAGDIACDPTQDGFNDGQGVETRCRQLATSQLLAGAEAVLALGDIQYEDGALERFVDSYDRSWGAFKDITFPAVGNHEYLTDGAAGYFDYFGARAGERGSGYYAVDLNGWRMYALNSNCSAAGGCGRGDPMYDWLAADLAAHPRACSLAFMHHPRWSSGKYQVDEDLRSLVDLLDDRGVDVMLAGHAHSYERFAPQTADGIADPEGIRAFVVGTGGRNLIDVDVNVLPNSEARNDTDFGVLDLRLRDGSYAWSFLPAPGGSFMDAGSDACR